MAFDYDKQKKLAQQEAANYKEQLNTETETLWNTMVRPTYDKTNETYRANAENQIQTQKQEYRGLHDQNAVQELLDRRYTNEAMANAGLTDSGLNRTQQTAITLARGNRDASLTRQQQAAQDATMLALDQMIAENEAKAAADYLSLKQGANTRADQYLSDLIGSIGDVAEAENAQALALAKLDAEAKQKEADRLAESAKQLETNRLAVYADMIGAGYTSEEAWNEAIRLFPGAGENGEAKPTLDANSTPALKDRTFTKTKDTVNFNWLGILGNKLGIGDAVDNDDIVKDGAGNYYKLSELKKALIEDGMNETTAQQFVLNLTKMEKGQTYSGGAISGTKSSEIQKTVKSLKKKVNGTSYTEYSAAEEVIDKLYPNDTTAQKSALSQLGFTDAEIAIMLNAKKG